MTAAWASPVRRLLLLCAAALSRGAGAFDVEKHRIKSMMAAVYTPMKPGALELDLAQVEPYAAYMAKVNVTNVMPAGTNGESLSLSVSERKQLAEAWAKTGPPKGLKVYVHIGAESLVDALELARHAAATPGISGIVCMTPVYFKPTAQTLHDFLATISAAAPELPLWYYHLADQTGVLPGKAHTLLELAEESGKIPTLVGMKFTDYNLADLDACLQVAGGKYNMIFGRDDKGIAALLLGADTVVSSTINYSPTLREAVRLFEKGDRHGAEAAQERNAQLCKKFAPYAQEAKNVQKAIMRMVGVAVGPTRLPQMDLSDAESAALEATLRKELLIDPRPPGGGGGGAAAALFA